MPDPLGPQVPHVPPEEVIEGEAFALQLVEDHPVVDATDGYLAAVFFIDQMAAPLLDVTRADGADAQRAFHDREVAAGLLELGIDFQENDLLGIAIAHDHFPQAVDVGDPVQAGEVRGHTLGDVEALTKAAVEEPLEAVERRKALQLDETGDDLSGFIQGQREVDLKEDGMRGLAGDGQLGRQRPVCLPEVVV